MSRRSAISEEAHLLRAAQRNVPNARMWSESPVPPAVAWDGYEEEPAFDAGIHVGRWFHSDSQNEWASALASATPGSSVLLLIQYVHSRTVESVGTGLRKVEQVSSYGQVWAGAAGQCAPAVVWGGMSHPWQGGGVRLFIFNDVPDGDWSTRIWSSGGYQPGVGGHITFGNVDAPLRFPVVFGWGFYGGGWDQPAPDWPNPPNYLNGNCSLQDFVPSGWSDDPSRFTTRMAPVGTFSHDSIGAVGANETSITLYRET